MPNSHYLITLQVTAPNGRTAEDVITATTTLTTRRPFADAELRAAAVEQVAAETGKPAASLEVSSFAYTTLPDAL